MAFHVGQQVTLRREFAGGGWFDHMTEEAHAGPVFGEVYTVVDLTCIDGVDGVELRELAGRWYDAGCFRPLKATSIEVFRGLLTPTRERERV